MGFGRWNLKFPQFHPIYYRYVLSPNLYLNTNLIPFCIRLHTQLMITEQTITFKYVAVSKELQIYKIKLCLDKTLSG